MNKTLFQLLGYSLIHYTTGIAEIKVNLRSEMLNLHIVRLSEVVVLCTGS